ncbi:hypothetical protein HG536_0F04650 [Torulaspora globosa]|uniref:Uncharacterized protein n=1 Tax=Torulaspora globosa TaxID=48254 RepID=A0A7G3ZKV3_9SACH|nr:uncharacterized protein HG536_0F04650 [Torulaspora globosa]QLL34139.1 hypothetical protein HG536_0F04650 [Torulaspora globosa]
MAPSPPPQPQSQGMSVEEGLTAGMAGSSAAFEPESDSNFFRVITENLKYAFHSPLPNTQFPTPYSSNQVQMSQGANQGLQQGGSDNSSSLMENSMLPGLSGAANAAPGEALNDFNMQPSSVLQCGSAFPNEFLLASPEQFKEFLFESPAGFSILHKTPARTPLRFVSGSLKDDANSGNLFGNPMISSSHGKDANINKFTQTPLRSIDLNLMFNSNHMAAASSSPSKRVALSLTPYGRKVLHEIGTPYAKTLVSSNSALADFQKARKDVTRLHSSPPTAKKMTKTPPSKPRKKTVVESLSGKAGSQQTLSKESLNTCEGVQEADEDCYGSSPTTIQLNSSITKSSGRLSAQRIRVMTRQISESNVDDRLFKEDVEGLQLSPTPKCNALSSIETLKIPELPKMGSFKSETPPVPTKTATSKNAASSSSSLQSKAGRVKKTTKKQPKFQIIVANAQKFSVPTSQKSSKKIASLKRSRSMLAEPTAWTPNERKNKNTNSTNDNNNNNNGTSGVNRDSTNKKRSKSFTGNGQLYGFQ